MAGPLSESMIRAQLNRILASETFARSERLSRFLEFIVDEHLQGRDAGLKEQVLALELYGKGADFDSATDAAVRVDARRLRDKLREYYEAHASDPLRIVLPKGAYIPAFEEVRLAPSPRPWTGWKWAAAALAVTTVSVIYIWFSMPRAQAVPRITPLTSDPGEENHPALSPDGEWVAFTCMGAGDLRQRDICIKKVGTERIDRLTQTPETEYWPAWSPDGRDIVFGRGAGRSTPGFQEPGDEQGIFIARPGGEERRISPTGAIAGWTRDGKSVLIRDREEPGQPFAIFQVDLKTMARRRLTQPSTGAGDWRFDVSPDGKTLAIIRFQRPGIGDLYLLSLSAPESPLHPARRVTNWNRYLSGLAWTPDGKDLVYSLEGRLWRVSAAVDPPANGSLMPGISMPAVGVAISRPASGAARLVFTTAQNRVGLRLIDLRPARDGVIQDVSSFAPATRVDSPGRFSPDGSRVAFVSNRSSASPELWIASIDGTSLRQITSLGSAARMLAGGWSPDGRQIVFDAQIGDSSEIHTVPADGGKPVRILRGQAVDRIPEWSKDGRWIYYEAPDSGSAVNIWRIPAGGGTPQQITRGGGFEPQESPGGDYLYYADKPASSITAHLMKVPVGGGEAKVVVKDVLPFLWSVSDQGIYFLRLEDRVHAIFLHRFAGEAETRVSALPFAVARLQFPGRFSVSRDGRWALANVSARQESDLMLLDNFR